MHKRTSPFLLSGLLLAGSAAAFAADDANIIDAMDTNNFAVPAAIVKVEAVPGHTGQALQFSFADDAKSVLVQHHGGGATPEWDKAAGFSCWVKGDGSNHLGGIEFVWNNDYGQRYAYAFPINDTNWHKVVVPWRDLVPELAAPIKPIDPVNGNAPSKLNAITFGKWWYWGDYAAHSYAIDDIRLEPTIPLPTQNFRPPGAPLARVAAKLKAGQPITIVTMGDSLTDTKHWSNQKTNWPMDLQAALKAQYKSAITLVNPAMGGTILRQNLVVLPRWSSLTPKPDLVTVFFGFNDYDGGARGPEFYQMQIDAIRRIREATGGQADVLIMTTYKPLDNGERLAELADACRRAAKDSNAGIADIYSAFQAAPGDKASLYGWDKVHLGPPGQELVAKLVAKALAEQG